MFILIPGLELLLPAWLMIFPNAIPSQFQSPASRTKQMTKLIANRNIAAEKLLYKFPKYLKKLSAPFLDRIDLHVEVPPLPSDVLVNAQEEGECSAYVRERVERAVFRQRTRQGVQNSLLSGRQLEAICALSDDDKQFMQQALEKLKLSARAYHRVLKVALTLADLNDSSVTRAHLMESLSYRKMEKTLSMAVSS